MRPEFPVDKWLRKHMGPWRTLGTIAAFMALLLYAAAHLPQIVFVCMIYAFLAFAVSTTIWSLVWNVKHPCKPVFCKECGRAKPEKYED